MSTFLRDVRHGFRGLVKAPGFTLVAGLTLALGIGVNSGIFSLVNAVLLRPLPVERPGELVDVYGHQRTTDSHDTSSWPDYLDMRAAATTLSGLVAYSNFFANMASQGRSELVLGEVVSDNYFDVLGVRPALGRAFLPEEFVSAGTHPVVVLGHEFWRSRFAADPGIVGSTVRLNGTPYTVVGVAPEGFGGMFPAVRAQMWIPVTMVEEVEPLGNQRGSGTAGLSRLEDRGRRWLWLRGRRAEGAAVPQVRAELEAIVRRLAVEHPGTNELEAVSVIATSRVRVNPDLDRTLAPAGALVLAIAGLVLLVACANLANMQLARASARRKELAIRLAMGASRRRLLRQLLTESLLLALLGGAAGVLCAALLVRWITAWRLPLPVDFGFQVGIDWRVLVFALVASCGTGIAFGLLPALRASRPDLVPALKDAGAARGRARLHARDVLVVVQLAFSLVLLVAGALMTRSLSTAHRVELGYDPDRLAHFALAMEMNGYDVARSATFFEEARSRLEALPGVEGVTLMSRVPLSLNDNNFGLFIEGRQRAADDPPSWTGGAYVDAGYFDALGLTMLEGRALEASDALEARRVAVVTAAMAERYWPGGSALGREFRTSWEGTPWEVVGVVEDYRVGTPGEAPTPYLHLPFSTRSTFGNVVVRTREPAQGELQRLERELRGIDPELVFLDAGTLRSLADVRLLPIRAGAVLMGAFGVLALAIAAVGLYGVIAYSVTRRTREIGIRVALGATSSAVERSVIAGGMRLVAIGGVAGALLAVLVGKGLSSALYVSAFDPASFGLAFGTLATVALAANWVPARRAARVSPLVALKSD